jgi:16S rRNA (guanine527-N7)-methyltransferase
MYIDILIRWNARINLTAIRDPEEIVVRHFGESLFAARHVFPETAAEAGLELIDIGSGAGFPGIPMKIWEPALRVTLIESNQKKATFLREVIRGLTLTDIHVFSSRAEEFPGRAGVVSLRAVERFEAALAVAARLVGRAGRLVLLIGASQVAKARELVPEFDWADSICLPQSSKRVLLVGSAPRV